jgi:hypothetical protein
MNKQEFLDTLNIQSILGRTKSGWDLGQDMLTASSGSIVYVDKEGFLAKECLNCELVLSAELFVSGCPNCGSKDHKNLDITVI